MERVRAEKAMAEQKYLQAAACLCAEMYAKGCQAITVTIDCRPFIVNTSEVLIYLAGKIEEVRKQ